MLTSDYVPGDSVVHRARPLIKVGLLFLVCTWLFVREGWLSLAAAGLVLVAFFAIARIPPKIVVAAIRPALWVLGLVFVAQLFLADWRFAGFVVLRFAVMILAASLLTLTTRTSDLVEAIERALGRILPARSAEAISLALSLCMRFIPRVRDIFEEVKNAQRARGLGTSWRALVTPTIVRALKSADEIARAIVARSPDGPHVR
ncbi:MAG: energy-coupling factor transporter transmembrane protein EcfT [Roseitalea sp.]|jgi:biotin transport system permease protein|nr:energy-coupling factor transporter transmembrane protein EcfT [Roseitalea sp.]MBO6721614.1 energy-coupling factor transporter transmembrane protein EcfT [Roseitalea sp.]MBO6743370.1 energy-coupling factor transporter transmembrane protein EcfT [Roseitalea sp.]